MSITIYDSGPADAEVLVFLHGYPDDSSMWDLQVAHFEKQYRCLRLELPNYGDSIEDPAGYDFESVTRQLHDALTSHSPALAGPFTLIVHDWGAFYGYLFTRHFPELVKRLVALDVGAAIKKQPNPIGYLMIPTYQLSLAFAFALSRIPAAGPFLGNMLTKGVLAGLGLFGSQYSGPTRRTPLSPVLNYPYFYFWKDALTGKLPLSMSLPDIPFFFGYGTQGLKKVMMFHDERWLNKMGRKMGNKVVAFEQSSHWLMRDEPEKLNHEIESFLQQS
ncbi:MAG: alpha/beta fold hydrolase [Pseudomonadota bacterium]